MTKWLTLQTLNIGNEEIKLSIIFDRIILARKKAVMLISLQ